MGATDTAGPVDAGVEPSLVDTIQNIEEGDVLVVNGDSRTWDVTDVVDRSIEDPNDARESKRVCRLPCGASVFGLELVAYPDRYTASLHVLATEDWTEDGRVFEVHDIEILTQQVPWVVVTGGADRFISWTHRQLRSVKHSQPVVAAIMGLRIGLSAPTPSGPHIRAARTVCAIRNPLRSSRSHVHPVQNQSATGFSRAVRWGPSTGCRSRVQAVASTASLMLPSTTDPRGYLRLQA